VTIIYSFSMKTKVYGCLDAVLPEDRKIDKGLLSVIPLFYFLIVNDQMIIVLYILRTIYNW
jgi:hypothetical protein